MAYCVDFLVDYWVLDHTRNCTGMVAVVGLHILSFKDTAVMLRQNISSSSNLVSGFSIISRSNFSLMWPFYNTFILVGSFL